jgi:hypothetical protein
MRVGSRSDAVQQSCTRLPQQERDHEAITSFAVLQPEISASLQQPAKDEMPLDAVQHQPRSVLFSSVAIDFVAKAQVQSTEGRASVSTAFLNMALDPAQPGGCNNEGLPVCGSPAPWTRRSADEC